MMDYQKQLSLPFKESDIQWRPGATNKDKTKAIALAYIDARAVMARLDEVLGTSNWMDSYLIEGSNIVCTLSLRFPPENEWISKSDAAAMTDVESIKGGVSDAFKRAAVKFGIGRYLYDVPNSWHEIAAYGKSWRFVSQPRLPAEFLPKEENV